MNEIIIRKRLVFMGATVIFGALLLGALFLPVHITAFSVFAKKVPQVKLETTKGDIIIELNQTAAPITVENFLSYVDEGHFDGTVFHRVIDGFMIQGGGFTQDGTQKETHTPIALESNNGLKNVKGTIAMARTSNPNSATSQFFINTVDNNFLDYTPSNPGYAVFGTVTQGMDIVSAIEKTQTTTKYSMKDWPTENIIILKASRV